MFWISYFIALILSSAVALTALVLRLAIFAVSVFMGSAIRRQI